MKKMSARGATLGLWFLNILFLAALLDVAIESALSGSPLRFAVAGAVTAYTVSLGLAWRRLDLAMTAGASLAAFAALLAFSGWRTGSIAAVGGITVVGRSADVAAAVLLLVLFVAALISLAIAPRIPPWVRASCMFVLAYAALPLGAALRTGEGIDAALRNNVFLPSDPFWLRGGFIGVAFLIPLIGIVALLVASLWAIQGRRRGALRMAAIALVGALAAQIGGLQAATIGLPSPVAFEHASSAPAQPVSVAPARDDASATAIKALAARLSSDPDALLKRAANGISPAVYDGVQQGALGTLAAGVGNSADKALLLSALIRAAEPSAQVRFATCTLSPEQTAQVVTAARIARRAQPKILFQNAGALAGQTRDAVTRRVFERAAAMWQTLRVHARTETTTLADGLRQADVAAEVPPAFSTAYAYATNHVWLQLQRNGTWVDLDPTIVPAAVGQARCRPDGVSPMLPARLYATLTVRVKVEYRTGSDLHSINALEQTLRLADLADINLGFAFAEPAGLRGVAAPPVTPAGMRAYTPLLRVGDDDTLGQPIFLPRIPAAPVPLKAMAHGFDQVLGALDTPTPGAATTAPSAPSSQVTGAWLEFSLATPSAPPETLESPLFDRIGFAARAAGAAASATLLPLSEAGGEYLDLTEVWNIALWTGDRVLGVDGDASVAPGSDVPTLFRALGRVHSCYYLLRRALLDDSTAVPATLVATRPSLSLLGFGLTSNTPGAVRSRPLIDVASDHTLALAAPGADAVSARASFAVASLLAERTLVDGSAILSGKGGPDDIAHADNDVLGIFDAARRAEVALDLLHPADAANGQTLGASPEARARVAARLAAGDAVLVPSRALEDAAPENFGWWVVDPSDGSIRDEMQDGRHQDLPEEAAENKEVVEETAPIMRTFGKKIASYVICAASVLMPFAGAVAGEGAESSELAEQSAEAMHAISEGIEESKEELEICAEE
jgi:transglutaminase-like putative cysteine protease